MGGLRSKKDSAAHCRSEPVPDIYNQSNMDNVSGGNLSKVERENLFNEAERIRLEGQKNESAALYMRCLIGLEVKTAFPSLPKCLRALASHFMEKEEYVKSIHFVQAERLYYESALIDTAELQQKLTDISTSRGQTWKARGGWLSQNALGLQPAESTRVDVEKARTRLAEYQHLVTYFRDINKPDQALEYAHRSARLSLHVHGPTSPINREILGVVHELERQLRKLPANQASRSVDPKPTKTDEVPPNATSQKLANAMLLGDVANSDSPASAAPTSNRSCRGAQNTTDGGEQQRNLGDDEMLKDLTAKVVSRSASAMRKSDGYHSWLGFNQRASRDLSEQSDSQAVVMDQGCRLPYPRTKFERPSSGAATSSGPIQRVISSTRSVVTFAAVVAVMALIVYLLVRLSPAISSVMLTASWAPAEEYEKLIYLRDSGTGIFLYTYVFQPVQKLFLTTWSFLTGAESPSSGPESLSTNNDESTTRRGHFWLS